MAPLPLLKSSKPKGRPRPNDRKGSPTTSSGTLTSLILKLLGCLIYIRSNKSVTTLEAYSIYYAGSPHANYIIIFPCLSHFLVAIFNGPSFKVFFPHHQNLLVAQDHELFRVFDSLSFESEEAHEFETSYKAHGEMDENQTRELMYLAMIFICL